MLKQKSRWGGRIEKTGKRPDRACSGRQIFFPPLHKECHRHLFRFTRCIAGIILFLFVAPESLMGEKSPLVLPANEYQHVLKALHGLNMTEIDAGFHKDAGEPLFAFNYIREMLHAPFRLPALADRVSSAVESPDVASLWPLLCELLETRSMTAPPRSISPELHAFSEVSSPLLRQALRQFYRTVEQSDASFNPLTASPHAREAAVSFLTSVFHPDDDLEARKKMMEAGWGTQLVERVIREDQALDPKPFIERDNAAITDFDLPALLAAARTMQAALDQLGQQIVSCSDWPRTPERYPTPWGAVFIGSPGNDSYHEAALLLVDPGGDDHYTGKAGQANGFQGQRWAAIIDLQGDDHYEGTEMSGPGSGWAGAAFLIDYEGDDLYNAAYTGQGSGLFGVGWLEDRGGNDIYRARAFAQAAGYAGAGVLRDLSGHDLYQVGCYGQGMSGVRGAGILFDRQGHDRYFAGGRYPDHGRHGDRFLSLSQGFSIGRRPWAGGGFAALIDQEGNDTYIADIYGQGVSYWYAMGMLLDHAGHDTYRVHHYGQGSGIHLSLGLLADRSGNDQYTGYILTQGNAHDYAVGMLFDQAGDDTYTADHYAQGRAIYNAFALLLDSAGDDAYFARQPQRSQGMGHDGRKRDYGSLGLLLDLNGNDRYSSGVSNNQSTIRPDFGMIYDHSP